MSDHFKSNIMALLVLLTLTILCGILNFMNLKDLGGGSGLLLSIKELWDWWIR